MDNSQYFFSNEEESNDSNVNMIGGGGSGDQPLMQPMTGVKRQKMLNAAGKKAVMGKELSFRDGKQLERAMGKGKGPSKGKGGSGKGKGGPGGMGGPGSGGPNAANVAGMPTTSNSKQKPKKASSAKDNKCKKEIKKISSLTEKNKLLELKIDGLTVHLNQLQNILAVYEKQFTDFSEQKKIFDKTLIDMKEILVTKEAQKFGDEFKAMLEKRTKQANNQETTDKECDCSGQTPNPNPGLTPPKSPNPGQPQPPPTTPNVEAQSPPTPNAETQTPTPPQPNVETQTPTPNAGQTPTPSSFTLDIDSLKESIETHKGDKDKFVETKAQEKQTEFTEIFRKFGETINKDNYTKDEVNAAIVTIQTAVDTLHAGKAAIKKSKIAYGITKTFLGDPITIASSRDVLANYMNNPNTIDAASNMIQEKDKAKRDKKVKIFVKSFITEEKEKKIEGLEEIFPDESTGEKEEGDKCKPSNDNPRGNCGENLICKKGKGIFSKAKCVKDENATTSEGQDENPNPTSEGQDENPNPTTAEGQDENPNPTTAEGQDENPNPTTDEQSENPNPTAEAAPVQTTNVAPNPTTKDQEPKINPADVAESVISNPVTQDPIREPNPESKAIKATGTNASSPEKEALKRKEELKNLEESKKKKDEGDDCENKVDCKDDLECRDKKCKKKQKGGTNEKRRTTPEQDSSDEDSLEEDSLEEDSLEEDSLDEDESMTPTETRRPAPPPPEDEDKSMTPPETRRPAPPPPTEEQQDEDEKKTEIPKSYEGDLCIPGMGDCGEQLKIPSGLTCVAGKCVPNICGIIEPDPEEFGSCGERECLKNKNEEYFTCKEKEGKTKSKRGIGEQCKPKLFGSECKDDLMCDETGFYPTCQKKKGINQDCKPKLFGSECADDFKCDKKKKKCIQKGGSRNKTRRRRARRQRGSGKRKKSLKRSKTN